MSNLSKYKPQFTPGHHRYAMNNDYTITNYIKCDGSLVSQSVYPELFNAIGLIPDNTDVSGIIWTARTSGTSSTINTLIYGNGFYVYAGDGGTLATSTNAITWTTRTSGTTSIINALTYGNVLYVYAGNGGTLATSADAITWTTRTSGTTSSILALTYGNGLYVYAGNGGTLATSTNAITWTTRTSGTTSTIQALTYANSIYVYGGDGGVLATSTDAITWTTRTSGTTGIIRALTYGNGLYLYFSDDRVSTSTDAITWTNRITEGPATRGVGLIYGNRLYVLAYQRTSDNLYIFKTSIDGITWTSIGSLPTTGNIKAFAFSDTSGYVYGGRFGEIGTSPGSYTYNASTEFKLPTTINNSITVGSRLTAHIKYR